MEKVRIVPEGDQALLVEFGSEISPECNSRVFRLNQQIKAGGKKGIVETIPAFCSLLIYYEPEQIRYSKLYRYIWKLLKKETETSEHQGKVIEIPVVYGGSHGEDMERVCEHTGLSEEEVIALHTGTDYPIYMLGFLPGFPYLGGLDNRLATPRLQDPRKEIPPGSVGIGGEQTGIYPMASPGGWCLIGQTPLCLFDSERENPVLFQAGDKIRFRRIEEEEFLQIKKQEEESKQQRRVENTDTKNTLTAEGVEVVSPGAFTTIQDYGRTGYGDRGFSPSGAVDREAMELANLLVRNSMGEAVLECTLLGPSLLFHQTTVIAITGADMSPKAGDREIPLNCALTMEAGETLQLGLATKGCRAYIAFSGGMQVPRVLGSKSLNAKCGLGGGFGRALAAGDRIGLQNCRLPVSAMKNRTWVKETKKEEGQVQKVRVVMGPQDSFFTQEGIHTFTDSIYTVSNDSNRMACKMTGPEIERVNGSDIISDGIALGSIQVSSNGNPIIMLNDRQTTGGYAKIATVISTDIPILAQCKPGAEIRFSPVSLHEAERLYRQSRKAMKKLERNGYENEL